MVFYAQRWCDAEWLSKKNPKFVRIRVSPRWDDVIVMSINEILPAGREVLKGVVDSIILQITL